jgi:hypothetical protein
MYRSASRPAHPYGRRALIYAIDAADVPTASNETAMKTYAKKSSAQRAAKAAGHDLADIEIVKTKDGFTFRAKDSKPAIHVNNLAASNHPIAKTNADSWNAIPAVRRAGKKAKAGTASPRPPSKRAQIEADARAGTLPEPPDFSAETHKRFRTKLARLVELAKTSDIAGLKAIQINPVSTSPKAMARYRDLCIAALEARQRAG